MTLTGRMLGRYRLEALLGQGGMAEVYRATDTRLARTVAVKVILADARGRRDFVERFLREARSSPRSSTRTSFRSTTSATKNGVPYPRDAATSTAGRFATG